MFTQVFKYRSPPCPYLQIDRSLIDAAWGGYFASMLRDKPIEGTPDGMPTQPGRPLPSRDYVPSTSLKEHTIRQFEVLREADSVTIDPHKSGYCPYPSGGLVSVHHSCGSI